MATRTTVTLVDDLDGTSAETSVDLGLDGATYEIDLSATNAARLPDTVAQYIAAPRRSGGRRTGGQHSAPTGHTSASTSTRSGSAGAAKRSPEENRRIRTWALQHGAGVPDRGRIPGLLVTAYEANDSSLLPAATGAPAAEPATPRVAAAEVSSRTADENAQPRSHAATQPRGRDGLTTDDRERVRAWAVEQGIEVKARGQLKKDLIANYQAWSARQ